MGERRIEPWSRGFFAHDSCPPLTQKKLLSFFREYFLAHAVIELMLSRVAYHYFKLLSVCFALYALTAFSYFSFAQPKLSRHMSDEGKGAFFSSSCFPFLLLLKMIHTILIFIFCWGKNCLYFQKASEKAVNVQSTETEAEQRSGFGPILSICHRMWFVRWRRPRLWLPCPRTRRGRRSSVHCHCLCHFHCPNRPRRLTSCFHFLDPVAVGSRTTTVVVLLLCCWPNPHLQFRHSQDDQ